MYLVTIPTPDGAPTWLFFHSDSRQNGCRYPVSGVSLETFTPAHDEWTTEAQPHVLARLQRDPKRYRAFRSELDIHDGWDILDGHAEIWASWEAFCRTGVHLVAVGYDWHHEPGEVDE